MATLVWRIGVLCLLTSFFSILEIMGTWSMESELESDIIEFFDLRERKTRLSALRKEFVLWMLGKSGLKENRYSLKNSLLETVKEGDVREKLEGLQGLTQTSIQNYKTSLRHGENIHMVKLLPGRGV
ncbi:hypothetical protein AgCh_024208 [Apium graveolens]